MGHKVVTIASSVLPFPPAPIMTNNSEQNRHPFRWQLIILASLLCTLFGSSTAYGATPRSQAATALRQTKKDTDKLVKDLTTLLQMTGRWAPSPKGDDMQLCQSLQSFQQQVERLEKDNSAQRGYAVVQSQLQQLQFMTMNLEQQLNKTAGSPQLLSTWNSVKMDLNNAAQYIMPYVYGRSNLYDFDPAAPTPGSFVPSNNTFPNNTFPNRSPFTPDNSGFVPGASPYAPSVPGYYPSQQYNTNISPSPNSRNVQSAVRASETILERLIPQVSAFLQASGKWPPQQATSEMQLCQELQYFQQQLRRFGDEAASQTPYPVLQTQVQQLSVSFGNLDRLFFQTGASGEINARWNELRQQLNGVYQTFYSGGGQQFWSR